MLAILHALFVVLILFGAGMVLAAIDDVPLEDGKEPQMNGDER